MSKQSNPKHTDHEEPVLRRFGPKAGQPGRVVLVAGATPAAVVQARRLLAKGLRLTVVSQTPPSAFYDWAYEGVITLERRGFDAGDLDGASMVIAATGAADRDRAVATAAAQRGLPVLAPGATRQNKLVEGRKIMERYIITANRLNDGLVVYLTKAKAWSESLGDALVAGKAAAQTYLEQAELAADTAGVVAPYLIQISDGTKGIVPRRYREVLRAQGPSVRLDLGEQALSV